jgi:hypothetical protein
MAPRMVMVYGSGSRSVEIPEDLYQRFVAVQRRLGVAQSALVDTCFDPRNAAMMLIRLGELPAEGSEEDLQ